MSYSKNVRKKAFSLAEASILLIIGSLVFSLSTPFIKSTLRKQNKTSDTQYQMLSEKITRATPDGAVMFFVLPDCPDGWTPITDYVDDLQVSYTTSDVELANGENRALSALLLACVKGDPRRLRLNNKFYSKL